MLDCPVLDIWTATLNGELICIVVLTESAYAVFVAKLQTRLQR